MIVIPFFRFIKEKGGEGGWGLLHREMGVLLMGVPLMGLLASEGCPPTHGHPESLAEPRHHHLGSLKDTAFTN